MSNIFPKLKDRKLKNETETKTHFCPIGNNPYDRTFGISCFTYRVKPDKNYWLYCGRNTVHLHLKNISTEF